MSTQIKGDMAVARAITKFMELGYVVSLPITESAQYDLVIEKDGLLKRVQVKYSKSKPVDLRRIHSNSKGYVIKKYHDDFDWLFVFKPDGICYLIKRNIYNRSYVTPKEDEII